MSNQKELHHLHIVLTPERYQLLSGNAKQCGITKWLFIVRLLEGTEAKAEDVKRGLYLLAPAAVNQQKFLFTLEDGKVSAQPGHAFYVKMDLGIAQYHFEIGAGKENFQWQNLNNKLFAAEEF